MRDWAHRFNTQGVEGLSNKTAPGRSPALSDEQMAELRQIVLTGPDLAKDGVVRWRCCDLQGVIAERFSVTVSDHVAVLKDDPRYGWTLRQRRDWTPLVGHTDGRPQGRLRPPAPPLRDRQRQDDPVG